jgi:hypothetical protein
MATNPNSARITDASWWFMQQLLIDAPGSTNGGTYTDKPGYHGTRAQNVARDGGFTDYSVRAPADRLGPDDKTAGYDWVFPEAQAGDYRRMAAYGARLRAAFLARDPRLDGWREALGQTDLDTPPEGLDFQGHYERQPDGTHSWHWHLSEVRQHVESYDNKRAMLSVLRGETLAQYQQGDDMAGEYADEALRVLDGRNALGEVFLRLRGRVGTEGVDYPWSLARLHAKADALTAGQVADAARDQAVLAGITALANVGGVDAAPIVTAIEAVRAQVLAEITELQAENAALKAQLAAVPAAIVAELASDLAN